ncbi:hypothetical protein [Nocardia barduliensis]|uniref:hypothetical protein n=1 Tax=Nocardia barduliensis TaxID=2736643 RepID=UPI0015737243|nr:hypothetical protein [Nocardia barduliensis]
MPTGILFVESRPKSADEAAAYHDWYENTHLAEMCKLDGVVAARRLAVVGDDPSYIALYEIEADDLEAVRAELGRASRSGEMSPPVGLQLDPPPVVRLLRDIAAYRP